MRVPSLKLAGLRIGLLLGLLATSHAFAHGIWIEKRRGNLEVIYGNGSADDAYKTSKFHGAWAYDPSGKPVALRTQSLDTHVRLLPQGATAVVVAALNNGYYAQDADGKSVNQRKSDVPGATLGAGNWKYTLAILQADAHIPARLEGIRLAVIPEQDPTRLKAGETLPVRVLLDGAPLAGVKLGMDYKGVPEGARVETDRDGRARLTVRNSGLNVISASHTHQGSDDPDIDEVRMHSTLTFVATKTKTPRQP